MQYSKDTLAHRLKLFMRAKCMTQEELAAAADISDTTIGAYANGSMTPGIDKVWRIAEALGVTPNDLCGWSRLDGEMLEPAGR